MVQVLNASVMAKLFLFFVCSTAAGCFSAKPGVSFQDMNSGPDEAEPRPSVRFDMSVRF